MLKGEKMDSVVSYSERGVGGQASYRGNCSPRLIQDLIDFFRPEHVADYMVGGGTTKDVAIQNQLPYHVADLHSGFNMLTDDIQERNDFIFWHPPYHDIVQYSDAMYSSETVKNKFGYNPKEYDLSRCRSWQEFIDKLNFCMIKQFESLRAGGHLAVLMGDIKKRGKLYSMLLDICKPGKLVNIVIKMQHNCFSDRTLYANSNFIRLVHEYVLIVEKEKGTIYDLKFTRNYRPDMRDEKKSTWKDVLMGILESWNVPVPLEKIYKAVEGHKKAEQNKFYKEKIRQTLYLNSKIFCRTENGYWKLYK